jgi:hypothetical protein
MFPLAAFEPEKAARRAAAAVVAGGLLLLALLCHSTTVSASPDRTLVSAPGRRAPPVANKKHIDWYCQECPISFLDASSGGRPDLVDGIIPCCGSVDHGHHLDTALRINCTTGTLVDYSLTTDFTRYERFTAAGLSVNMDLNGFAACCHNETDCTILENKKKLAAQLLAIGLKYKFSGFSMDWEFGQSFHWAGFNETMTYVAGVLRPHGLGLGISINSDCNAANASADGGSMDPSCDPVYRNTPWASILSDMGTYIIGDLNATWAKNGTRGTWYDQPVSLVARACPFRPAFADMHVLLHALAARPPASQPGHLWKSAPRTMSPQARVLQPALALGMP